MTFWENGGLATPGIERMAETGSTSTLSDEINLAIEDGTSAERITGSGTGSPGTVTTTFSLTSEFHLVTLVSMIAPSPDWFVGVSGLSLLQNGVWVDELDCRKIKKKIRKISRASISAASAPPLPSPAAPSLPPSATHARRPYKTEWACR